MRLQKIIFLSIMIVYSTFSLGEKGANSRYSFDKNLSTFSYPFKVKKFEFNSQQQTLTMAYMDVGDNDSKKVMVLLHGKNFSGFYWQQVAQDLVDLGYRVIIPDQIGFGKSSKPTHYQYNFSQLALNTQKLLESLNVKQYSLVGHSMGGMLAVNMSYMFSDPLEKLILINPIGLEAYLDYAEFKDTDFFYQIELKKSVDKVRNYQKKNYYAGNWKAEYESLLTPIKGWINGPDWKHLAWNNALTYAPIFNDDIVSKFSKITTPTHLIIGTRDRTGPGRGWKKKGVTHKFGQYQNLGKEAQSKITNSTLYELSGLGHMPHIEDYPTFSKVFIPIVK